MSFGFITQPYIQFHRIRKINNKFLGGFELSRWVCLQQNLSCAPTARQTSAVTGPTTLLFGPRFSQTPHPTPWRNAQRDMCRAPQTVPRFFHDKAKWSSLISHVEPDIRRRWRRGDILRQARDLGDWIYFKNGKVELNEKNVFRKKLTTR